MQNKNYWMPSKYEYNKGKWRASRNIQQVSIGSRLVSDITATWYANNIPHYTKGKLLDLGCGRVPFFGMYQAYISENICVDWGNSFHKNNYLDIEYDLTQKLPFDDCTFDTIILSDVLEHIPEPPALFNEIYRLLKKEGKLILNVPFFYCLHECPHDYYRYTEFALFRFAEQNNLKIIKIDTAGGSIEILADILAKHLQFLPIIGKFFAIFIQTITYWISKTAVGQSVKNKTAKAFPLGYFLVLEK